MKQNKNFKKQIFFEGSSEISHKTSFKRNKKSSLIKKTTSLGSNEYFLGKDPSS